MSYIGNQLQTAFPSYLNIDDISGSFDGVTTSFALTVGGVAPVPAPASSNQCLISVGGVVQRPDDSGTEGFRLSGGNIIFSSAPTGGDDFFGVVLAGADYLNVGVNYPSGTAGAPSITFNTDLDTGIYNSGANEIGFTTSGTEKLVITNAGQIKTAASGTSASPALVVGGDVNSGLYSPGADQVAISTNGTGRLFVDSSGAVLVNTSTGRSVGAAGQGLIQIEGGSTARLTTVRNSSDAFGSVISLGKSRGASVGSVDILQSGDTCGQIYFSGADGTDLVSRCAEIEGQIDGTPGVDDMPGRLVFSTTADGSASPTERLRITSEGKVGIGTTSPSDLLHVMESSASAAAATAVSVAQFERSGNAAITISTSDTGNSTLFFGDTASSTIGRVLYDHSANALVFWSNSAERTRIDSAGRLLVGTSTPLTPSGVTPQIQLEGTSINTASMVIKRNSDDAGRAILYLAKSRGTSNGSNTIVQDNDILGSIEYIGADGSDISSRAASISCEVDGTPGANDMPGRLLFSVTLDGASSPTEAFRITNDRVRCYNQPAPTIESGAATLTVAELKTGIIEYTGSADTLTLPTGTLMEGGFSGIYTNMTFEWSVINTGSGTCTIGTDTGHTIVGSATIANGASGRFASRRTGSNTFVTYRLA